jgi:hypothetical protein
MTTIRWKSKEDREAWELDFAAMGSAVAHVNTDGLTEHVSLVDFYAVPPRRFIRGAERWKAKVKYNDQ